MVDLIADGLEEAKLQPIPARRASELGESVDRGLRKRNVMIPTFTHLPSTRMLRSGNTKKP